MFKSFDFKEVANHFLIVGIAIFFISYSVFFAVDFPFQDDFLLIQFVEGVTKPHVDLKLFFSALFSTQNDHKAVIPRLIALLNYSITGSLNYKFFILLTNLNIGYIYYFFFKEFKKLQLNTYLFIPVGLFLLQPLYYEISSWALSGMQQTFTTVFVILAIESARKNNRNGMYIAILFCFLATFTHGNGIFSFPAVICYYFFTADWKKLVVMVIFMIIAFLLYMANYETGQAAGLPTSITLPIVSFFGFVGSSLISFTDNVIYSVIFGGIIVAYTVFLILKRTQVLWKQHTTHDQGNASLLSVMVYIICMSLVIAVVRTSVGGGVSSRFQLYASMSAVIFYLLLLEKGYLRKKISSLIIITISVFYALYSYYRFTGIIQEKKVTYKSDIFNWKYNRTMFSVEKTIVNNASFYLIPAYQKGIFATTEPIVNRVELENAFKANQSSVINDGMLIEDWVINKQGKERTDTLSLTYFNLFNNEYPIDNQNLSEVYLILKKEGSDAFFLHAAMPKVEARKLIMTKGTYYKNGFNLTFRNDDLEEGIYALKLLRIKIDGSKSFFDISSKLKVKGERLYIETPKL